MAALLAGDEYTGVSVQLVRMKLDYRAFTGLGGDTGKE
jgi:hypothetical protein